MYADFIRKQQLIASLHVRLYVLYIHEHSVAKNIDFCFVCVCVKEILHPGLLHKVYGAAAGDELTKNSLIHM